MDWIRRVWRWIDTPIEDRYRSERIIRTPLDLLDEAIGEVKFYFDFLEMELEDPEEDDPDWRELEVRSLEYALDLIRDATTMIRGNEAARLGQVRATPNKG